jgi:hypothetical protein
LLAFAANQPTMAQHLLNIQVYRQQYGIKNWFLA